MFQLLKVLLLIPVAVTIMFKPTINIDIPGRRMMLLQR